MTEGLGPRLSDEQVQEGWDLIRAVSARLQERGQQEMLWEVAGGSSLAADDSKSDPYHCSHAATMALGAALDHMHALCALIFDAGILHPYAPYALARGVIENASIGLWLLQPPARSARIEHTLSWHAANIHDSANAMAPLGIDMPRSKAERQAKLREIAKANGCRVELACKPMTTTPIIQYAEEQMPDRALGPLFTWRLCSGFAHGRPWASLGLLEREEHEREEGGVVNIRQTNTLDRVLYAALSGYNVFEEASALFSTRAGTADPVAAARFDLPLPASRAPWKRQP